MERNDRRELHEHYHDFHYGFPLKDDHELFGRLIMEINQAGLSWETILRKEQNFRIAFNQFDINKIANYRDTDINRLLSDSGIIRNRKKIEAVIANAKVVIQLQQEFGSFDGWLATHHPREKADWIKLFRKNFKFVGGEIVGEFLMSIGYLRGAHDEDCPIYNKIMQTSVPWISKT